MINLFVFDHFLQCLLYFPPGTTKTDKFTWLGRSYRFISARKKRQQGSAVVDSPWSRTRRRVPRTAQIMNGPIQKKKGTFILKSPWTLSHHCGTRAKWKHRDLHRYYWSMNPGFTKIFHLSSFFVCVCFLCLFIWPMLKESYTIWGNEFWIMYVLSASFLIGKVKNSITSPRQRKARSITQPVSGLSVSFIGGLQSYFQLPRPLCRLTLLEIPLI